MRRKFGKLAKIVIIFKDNMVIDNMEEFKNDVFEFLYPYSDSVEDEYFLDNEISVVYF